MASRYGAWPRRPATASYADKDPLFQKTHSDRQARVSVNLLHRAVQVWGFTPYISYFYEWNRSNIPINAYRNHCAVPGISRTFQGLCPVT